MPHISARINLAKLKCAVVESKKTAGEFNLILPVKANNLYKSEKGNIYLDISCIELAEEKRQYSDFIIFQSFSKELREKMEANGEKSDILGNAKFFQSQEPSPNYDSNLIDEITADGENDDLPF